MSHKIKKRETKLFFKLANDVINVEHNTKECFII